MRSKVSEGALTFFLAATDGPLNILFLAGQLTAIAGMIAMQVAEVICLRTNVLCALRSYRCFFRFIKIRPKYAIIRYAAPIANKTLRSCQLQVSAQKSVRYQLTRHLGHIGGA